MAIFSAIFASLAKFLGIIQKTEAVNDNIVTDLVNNSEVVCDSTLTEPVGLNFNIDAEYEGHDIDDWF